MRKSRSFRTVASASVGAVALGLVGSGLIGLSVEATAVQDLDDNTAAHSPVTDVRDQAGTALATAAQVDAAREILATAGPGVRMTWDHRFGTPRTIYPAAGRYLSGPRAGSAVDVARAWLTENRAALGLSAADVGSLLVTRDHALPRSDVRVVNFAQTFGGLPAVRGGTLALAVDGAGRVLSYTGDTTRATDLLGDFSLSPAQALGKVAAELAPGVEFSPEQDGQTAGYDRFARGPFAASSYVKQAAFPTADGGRAAYRVLFVEKLDEGWDVVVDAGSGEVLHRRSLVHHDSEGTIYENYPGDSGKGGRPEVVSFGPTEESPGGYVDPTGVAGLPGPTTFGNNANTYANWSNFLVPADQGPRPVSPTSQFHYGFGDNWGTTKCQAMPPSYALDVNPAATNLFYHHNRIHDEFYDLGFTESGDNFQINNRGQGGQGGDPILGLVQAGAATGGAPLYTGRDNAYMLTLPDGIPPWSGMFLWEPINDAFEGECRDGDFDAGVIEHEYAHGLSNRYVGSEDGALNTHQSGAMGEGWGDWYGLNYLHREGLQETSELGAYATGNTERGIRNWAYDDNPVRFGDIGYDLTGPQVHADGEIWAATLWDMRKALVARYGQALGSEIAAQIVTSGMPLSPNDPSMLDMRDAIMTALFAHYGGRGDFARLQDLVYGAFAKRGMGLHAANNETGGDDTDPVPSFAHQNPALNGRLSGRIVNAATGRPIAGAKVMLGLFEARVSPIAKTSSQGGFSTEATAGTYPVTIQARGFGARTFRGIEVRPGRTTALQFRIAPNVVSLANGATIVGDGVEGREPPGREEALLDDTEASSWRAPIDTSAKPPVKPYVDIKLAAPATISSYKVSAYTTRRFEGLKDFTLHVSMDGTNWRTVRSDAAPAAFSYQRPRPVAPDVHYNRFTLASPVKAAYVRFTMTDRFGETLERVQAGELQVFANVEGLEPLPPEPLDEPFTEDFTIAVNSPGGENLDGGVTSVEFQNTCAYPPPSQDFDAHVTKVPESFGDGLHNVKVTGDSPAHDLDLYFFDENCELIGSAASSAADETGTIPSGAVYVLTHLWLGAAVPVHLEAVDTQ